MMSVRAYPISAFCAFCCKELKFFIYWSIPVTAFTPISTFTAEDIVVSSTLLAAADFQDLLDFPDPFRFWDGDMIDFIMKRRFGRR